MNRNVCAVLGIVLGVALAAAPLFAQSATYHRCMAKATDSHQRFTCNERELRIEDKRVDADYRKLQIRSQGDPARQADVRTDQRDWLAHRDSACSRPDEAEDSACMIRETSAKADQLDGRLR